MKILFASDPPTASAPPPAAPAPSPAPSPAPAAPAVPSPAPSPEDQTGVDTVLADLNKAFDAAEPKATGPSPVEPPPKPEGVAAKPSAAAPAPSPKLTTEPAKTPKELREAYEQSKTPKELREAYEQSKTELATKSKAIAALEAKIEEYVARGKDTESLTRLLASKEKEFADRENELQGKLRAIQFQASPEWEKQYKAPFDKAADDLLIYTRKIAKVDGSAVVFEQDVIPIYQLATNGTLGQAKAKARELFGEDEGDEIYGAIKDLVKLNRVSQSALEEEKANWKTKNEQDQGLRVQRMETNKQLWNQTQEQVQKSVPDYQDAPEEKEMAEWRSKGRAWADAIPKEPDKQRLFFAHGREMIAAFWPHKVKIRNLTAEISALKKQIEELKPRPPGGGNERPNAEEPGKKGEDTIDDWAKGARSAIEGVS